ncbi:hypothetical protein CEXT_156221 [Caerostris extrusa]|uniref:Ribosomal protein L5 n=1 Tax=Caerostris extrusa TaxID=172846 RepID=A0AAV4Y656_CAEEX|nr:hypothetical protein CEXT_156221 [Caerostris extrusa]
MVTSPRPFLICRKKRNVQRRKTNEELLFFVKEPRLLLCGLELKMDESFIFMERLNPQKHLQLKPTRLNAWGSLNLLCVGFLRPIQLAGNVSFSRRWDTLMDRAGVLHRVEEGPFFCNFAARTAHVCFTNFAISGDPPHCTIQAETIKISGFAIIFNIFIILVIVHSILFSTRCLLALQGLNNNFFFHSLQFSMKSFLHSTKAPLRIDYPSAIDPRWEEGGLINACCGISVLPNRSNNSSPRFRKGSFKSRGTRAKRFHVEPRYTIQIMEGSFGTEEDSKHYHLFIS